MDKKGKQQDCLQWIIFIISNADNLFGKLYSDV